MTNGEPPTGLVALTLSALITEVLREQVADSALPNPSTSEAGSVPMVPAVSAG